MVYVGFFGGAAALALAFLSDNSAVGGISLLVALVLFAVGGFSRGTS